ncbi:MAG: aliphatic sulfonate ABC transporter substrate-binding protein [Chlorobiaceae bacterium]|nr:aliphatic sulfonate ABC transporter substrate-binding protein [Chlorobiaceae bacterium]
MIIYVGILLGVLSGADLYARQLPSELSVDYAPYNPLSLVLKKFNWLENEFNGDDVRIRWVFSPGSDSALKSLKADSANISSSASLSSVWSKASGNPIKAFYVFTRAEWLSIVVSHDSPIRSVKELRGRRVAATPGTDPYFFLLRALREAGMHKDDVVIVPLTHREGRAALELKKVDAWVGGVPYSTSSQLENGFQVIYRNVLFNSDGFLNVSEDFANNYPQAVSRVVKVYERARRWALSHPDDLEAIFADEAKVPLPIARGVLSKFDFSNPVIEKNDIRELKDASPVLKDEKLIGQDTDLDKVIAELIDTSFVLRQLAPVSGSM